MRIFINATGKVEDAHLIDEAVSDRSLFEDLLVLAKKLNATSVTLNVPPDRQAGSVPLVSRYFKSGEYSFDSAARGSSDLDLDVRNVYNIDMAVSDYRKNGSLEKSVIWRIKTREDLEAAEAEITRSKWFPIGRFYIVPMAKALARIFARWGMTPNQVTLLSVIAALAAAALLVPGRSELYPIAGILYLVFWLLDITDGKLARMRNMVSDFGKWFDPVAGEAVDYVLHLAIVYNLYVRNHNPAILWVGIFYFIGKHLTLYLMNAGNEAFARQRDEDGFSAAGGAGSLLAKVAHFVHDADIRKHFIALSICFNIMIVPLTFYAVYYNAWALSKFVLEYARYRRRGT